MVRKPRFQRDGVLLAGIDFGGNGPPVLLLHGLAGHASEWTQTASWLCERARVLALDAPRRIVLQWLVDPAHTAGEVEVSFTPQGDATRVVLEHRGWEQYDDGGRARRDYDDGWDVVLGRYVDAAS